MNERQQLLWTTASSGTGQGKIVAQWLLSMWNGYSHHVNLIDVRALDTNLFLALMAELTEEALGRQEIQRRYGKTDEQMVGLRDLYGIKPLDEDTL